MLDDDVFRRFVDLLSMHLGPSVYGHWLDRGNFVKDGQSIPITHAALLRTGKVLFIEAACNIPVSRTPLWTPGECVAEPCPPLVIDLPTPPTDNLYCSGHCFLSDTDGTLLVVGGGGEHGQSPNPNMAWKFPPGSETWTYTQDAMNVRTTMVQGRWYPTVLNLGHNPGRVLIASGDPSQMEVYFEDSGLFRAVTAQPPDDPTTTVDANYDKPFSQLYPGLHSMPSGEIFYAPVGFSSASVMQSGYFTFTGMTTGKWADSGDVPRQLGMSALLVSDVYPYVQVMVVGGGSGTSPTTYRIANLSASSPSWGAELPLPPKAGEIVAVSRRNVNVVLLPDGTVFVNGGASADEPCLLYNPAMGTWSLMAELKYPRAYHSLSLLLRTGEVLSTGGSNNVIEVFRPPYLSNGPRPTITTVPGTIHHGAAFTIETPDAGDIAKVTLVRPMAVTHQTDTEQRVIPLSSYSTGATSLSATAPNGPHPHALAPRGHYMLFLINSQGVPSVAEFVYLH